MTVDGIVTARLLRKALPKPAAVQRQPVVLERPLRGPERVRERRPPARGVHEVLRTERREQDAQRRDQPEQDDDRRSRSGRTIHRAAYAGRSWDDGASARRRLVDLGDRDRGRAHRVSSCSRNRRMFQIITGMMATNRTTAIAAPRPSLLRDEEPVDHPLGDHLRLVGLRAAHDEDDVEDLQRVDDHVGGHHDDRRQRCSARGCGGRPGTRRRRRSAPPR